MVRIWTAALALGLASPALAGGLPTHVGQCVKTTVKAVEARLMDGSTGRPIAGSGSAIAFMNGGYQVSYDQVPAIDHSRRGDPVKMCLVSIPHDCPPGDNRGRSYQTTNLRTHGAWTLPDSEHMCGGA